MSENCDRTAERDGGGVEDGGVDVVEVVGESVEGEGKAADEDGAEDGGWVSEEGKGGRRTRLSCRMWLRCLGHTLIRRLVL